MRFIADSEVLTLSSVIIVGLSTTPLTYGYVPYSSSCVLSKSCLAAPSFGILNSFQGCKYGCNCCKKLSQGGRYACNCCRIALQGGRCGCKCCRNLNILRMSEMDASTELSEVPEVESSTTDEDVPPEVVALEGINDEQEAHNVERPVRGSGIHKKKKATGKELSEFEEGQTVQGRVKTITSYGAFLDIGAVTDALLHVSQMSEDFVSNPEDVVKQGDEVEVRIVKLNKEKGQIGVTMKSIGAEAEAADRPKSSSRRDRPRRSGGDREAQYKIMSALNEKGFDNDKFIEGEVVSSVDFGAFVRFETSQLQPEVIGELDGLVHISVLQAGRVNSVDQVCKVGDKVQIRVKSLEADKGKVSLSMISPDEEKKSRSKGSRKRSPWSDKDMGPKDWKEQMEKVLLEQPEFKNMPIIVDNRK